MNYLYSLAVRHNSPLEWYCFLRSSGCTPAGLLGGWWSAWSFDLMTPAGHWKGWKKNKELRDEQVLACFTASCKKPQEYPNLHTGKSGPNVIIFSASKGKTACWEQPRGANLLTPSLPRCFYSSILNTLHKGEFSTNLRSLSASIFLPRGPIVNYQIPNTPLNVYSRLFQFQTKGISAEVGSNCLYSWMLYKNRKILQLKFRRQWNLHNFFPYIKISSKIIVLSLRTQEHIEFKNWKIESNISYACPIVCLKVHRLMTD